MLRTVLWSYPSVDYKNLYRCVNTLGYIPPRLKNADLNNINILSHIDLNNIKSITKYDLDCSENT